METIETSQICHWCYKHIEHLCTTTYMPKHIHGQALKLMKQTFIWYKIITYALMHRKLTHYETMKIQQLFLNQVSAGHRSVHIWFLKIVSVRMSACMCVCLPLRLFITSGVIWTPYDWFKRFYSYCMANVVIIVNGHGLCIDTHHPIKDN